MRAISGRDFIRALADAGIVNLHDTITQVTIDAAVGDFVRLTVTRAVDEDTAEVMTGALGRGRGRDPGERARDARDTGDRETGATPG
jgi:hypothetical protein